MPYVNNFLTVTFYIGKSNLIDFSHFSLFIDMIKNVITLVPRILPAAVPEYLCTSAAMQGVAGPSFLTAQEAGTP